MRRSGRTLVCGALCILTLAFACGGADGFGPAPSGSSDPRPDGGQDAGQDPEAGSGDAGLPPDAGTDAGPAMGTRIQVPPDGRLYHGVFPAGTTEPDSDISLDAADAYSAAVGRPLAYVYFSNEWFVSKAFPRVTAEAIRARGAVPFIRLHMRSQDRQLVADPLYTLDNINAGMFDSDLRAWADRAKAFGTALIVQYGTEVNGDWNPWSAKYNGGYDVGPGKFRQAFRHIVEVMRAEGASN
ncbi:MAG TPA: hypothetical protein VGG91_10540, partial [Myxococcaceae bacterium]